MKRIASILALGIILFTFTAIASGKDKEKNTKSKATTVNGVVVDKTTGETLAGVTVKIVGTNLLTVTDLDGHFKFSNINPGNYNISISYISYKDFEKEIRIDESLTGQIHIEIESR